MTHLKFTSNYCFLSSGERVLLLKYNEDVWKKCPKFNELFDNFKNKNISKETVTVSCFDFSTCQSYLAICTSDKFLLLFKLDNGLELVSTRPIARSSSAMRFTQNNQLITISDKSGDVYSFSVSNSNEPAVLCLGHLSMLLDLLPTPDSKYILTCDRDEKIRVSHFPNAYNIENYCLGHTAFVSSLTFLAHDNQILVSTSGDGTLKFWKYLSNEMLYTLDCSKYVLDNYTNLLADRETNESENDAKILPVRYFRNILFSNEESLACISLSTLKALLIYSIKTENGKLFLKFIQIIQLEEEPYDSCLTTDKQLWTLIPSKNNPVQVFTFDGNQFSDKYDDERAKTAFKMIIEEKEMFASYAPPSTYTYLYKQKFDNIDEYHKRKNLRLSSLNTTNKKSKC